MTIYEQYQSLLDKTQKGGLLPIGGQKSRRLWVPTEGENLIRILPWERDPETLPENLKRAFTIIQDDGTEQVLMSFFLPVKVHSIANDLYTCGVTMGERCPVCAEGSNYWQLYEEGNRLDTTLKELAKRHFSQDKYVSAVIPIKDETTPFEGAVVKPYLFGKSIFEGIMGLILKVDRTKKFIYGDVTNREEGRIIGFTRTGKSRIDTKYKDFFAIENILPVPISISSIDLLEEFLKEYPYNPEKMVESMKSSLVKPNIPTITDIADIIIKPSIEPDNTSTKRTAAIEDIRKMIENMGVKNLTPSDLAEEEEKIDLDI